MAKQGFEDEIEFTEEDVENFKNETAENQEKDVYWTTGWTSINQWEKYGHNRLYGDNSYINIETGEGELNGESNGVDLKTVTIGNDKVVIGRVTGDGNGDHWGIQAVVEDGADK